MSDPIHTSDTAKTSDERTLVDLPGRVRQGQFLAGDLIDGRYQVVSVLGRGGFGCVYRVNQVLLRKDLALKALNPINSSDVMILRMRKEAQAASRLDHPNLVKAVDFGMIDGSQPFLVMELIEGPTLSQYLKDNGKMSVKMALEIFIPLADGLSYAHQQGVVHRDLKPSNILLAIDSATGNFIPKIADFGIAKIQFADDSHAMTLTGTGDVFGTPLYMSPEQCTGGGVEPRSDIYSLGCMLFESLTGAPPFRGRNPLEIMMQHGTAVLPSLKEASLGETFAPELERVVSSMLAKLPEERYENCQYLGDDLRLLQSEDFDRLRTIVQRGSKLPRPPKKKGPAVFYAALVGCTILGAAMGYVIASLQAPVQAVSKPHEALEELDSYRNIGSMKPGATYFSNIPPESGERRFEIPISKEHRLGTLHWWNGNQLIDHIAAGQFSVPKDAKLILSANGAMIGSPYLWGQFHHNELFGVIFDRDTNEFPAEYVNDSVRAVLEQDDLHILSVPDKYVDIKTFRRLGGIPDLRWLDLVRPLIELDKNDGLAKGTFVNQRSPTGAEVASLSNLKNLVVLRLEKIDAVTPALVALSKNNFLRRLSLAEDELSEGDLKLIAQLGKLEVLSVRQAVVNGDALIDVVAHLKHLKILVIESRTLQSLSPESLRKLQGPKILVANAEDKREGTQWNAFKDVYKSRKDIEFLQSNVIFKQKKDADGGWFDCLVQPPGEIGI